MRGLFAVSVIIGSIFLFPLITAQITYNIGVQDIYSAGANLNLKMTGNNVINIVSVTIQDSSNITALTAETSRLSNLDYLIYIYNQTASLVINNMFTSNRKIVPYLVLPEMIADPILNPNMFYVQSQISMGADTTRALLTYLNASDIVYIDYSPQQTNQYLIGYNNFGQTLTIVISSLSWPPLLETVFQGNSQRFYVCAVPLTESSLIVNLLTEAMYKGQLNPGKVWIFIDVTSNAPSFNIFQQFSAVGADIYGMLINFPTPTNVTSMDQMRQAITLDYIRLIANSVNITSASKPANASLQLLNSVLPVGQLVTNAGFNSTTHIANGTIINVMKINAKPAPIPMLVFNGNLEEYNLNNLTLKLNDTRLTVRIGVVLSKAYFMQNAQNAYYGFSYAILNELLKLSNFKYTFVFAPDGLTGEVVTQNGSAQVYSGIISLMNQSLVDMSIIPMLPKFIEPVIYQSDILTTFAISFLTRPANETINFTLLFVPFSYNVWCAIAGIILLSTIAFYSINKISPNQSKGGAKDKLETYSFLFSLLIIYSSFVTAKLKIKPTQPSLQIFAFILWFSTLTLVITYASNMLPFLIKPTQSYAFKTILDLYPNKSSTGGFNWVFVNNSVELQLIQNDSYLSILYNTAVTNWPNSMLVNDTISHTAMATDKLILIQNSNKNQYMLNRICNSTEVITQDVQYNLILPMRTTWPQRFEMKGLISQLIASGRINSIVKRYFALGPCAKDVDILTPTPQSLTLLGSTGLFMLPLLGIVIGLSCMVLHVIIIKLVRCHGNMKRDKFKYGEMYTGEINSIEPDGVWAKINDRERPYFISSTSLHPDLQKRRSPKELGLKPNDTIHLKYFGKDPVNGYKRFCRDIDEESI